MKLSELLETLGYDTSSHYYSVDEPVNIEVAHCFRAAREVGVNGQPCMWLKLIQRQKQG